MKAKTKSYLLDTFILALIILSAHVTIAVTKGENGFVFTQTDYKKSFKSDSSVLAPSTSRQPIQSIIISDGNGNQVGKIDWKDGVIKFEGKVDESAKIFFEFLIKQYIWPYQGQEENKDTKDNK